MRWTRRQACTSTQTAEIAQIDTRDTTGNMYLIVIGKTASTEIGNHFRKKELRLRGRLLSWDR